VKVIVGEECASQHLLPMCDVTINGATRKKENAYTKDESTEAERDKNMLH